MMIQLNGEQHNVEGGITVAGLLEHLGIRLDQVAVEINLEIMEKSGFETRLLKEGDLVEVMSFIGGGSPRIWFVSSGLLEQNIER